MGIEVESLVIFFLIVACIALVVLFFVFVRQGREVTRTYYEENPEVKPPSTYTPPPPSTDRVIMSRASHPPRAGAPFSNAIHIYSYSPMKPSRVCANCDCENEAGATNCCVCGHPL